MQCSPEVGKKAYEPPHLRERTLEQAKLFCLGYAWIGHRGAMQLLELLFAPAGRSPSRNEKKGKEKNA